MSSRFHNKYHRHNHHTASTQDPRYPDSGHDPIASHDSPFKGDFVLQGGALSATALSPTTGLSGNAAGVFSGAETGIRVTAPVAIEANGSVNITGALSAQGIIFTGANVSSFHPAATANGSFLVLNINGVLQGIRLWTLP